MAEQVMGNLFFREWRGMAKGQVIEGHQHHFDHVTVVFIGGCRVKFKLPDGRTGERTYQAPTKFLVRAEVEHEITALEDGTELWCMYSHRTAQGDVVQEYTGWEPAYG